MCLSRGSYSALNGTCVYVCTMGCGSWVDEFLYSYSSDCFVCVCVCVCVCGRLCVWSILSLTSYLHRTLSTYM